MQDGRLLAVVLIDVGITGRLKPLRNALRLHLALGRFLAIGYEYDTPVGQIGRLRIVTCEGASQAMRRIALPTVSYSQIDHFASVGPRMAKTIFVPSKETVG